ncbi:DNA (cytosine-5)-methyltransferase 1 [Roseateles asaccharophilus]|uniref:DNA cytosine methyltransferase n=1 Tax=Roseateles asaccharophilus TaxID=582607 RepID=UPI003832A414
MKAIDLFAGAGGFSTGAKMAGIEVVWAANHWPLAVEYHEANHPGADHKCQDLHQADWRLLPKHDIGLASPCCQGHSPARGKDRPHHDTQRSTAWAVVSCAEYHRQDFFVVENVPFFKSWALFPSWIDAMHRLGYVASENLIDAADHGVPQNRERLYMVFSRSKAPIDLKLEKTPHTPVNSVIDWSYPKWSQVDKPGRSQATLNRIRSGRARFGRRFVAPFYGSGSGETGRSIHRPIGTITTHDRWAVVDGDRMRMLQRHEVKRIMGFPADYILPPTHKESIHLLGNAVCPPVPAAILNALVARG